MITEDLIFHKEVRIDKIIYSTDRGEFSYTYKFSLAGQEYVCRSFRETVKIINDYKNQ